MNHHNAEQARAWKAVSELMTVWAEADHQFRRSGGKSGSTEDRKVRALEAMLDEAWALYHRI